ncbi:MAG: POTRA domain-containing protein [Candidatus Margulisiibacteriota bacterium]|jgi:outer membrane protein insertion porin family
MNFKNKLLIISFVCFLCFFTKTGFASQIVRDVEVIGLKNIAPKEITNTVDLPELLNQEPNQNLLKEYCKKIYLLGFFNKVDVELEEIKSGIKIKFLLLENPVIKNIIFKGATVFSSNQLTNILINKKGAVLNITDLEKDKANLDTLYKNKGYDLFKIVSITINQKEDLVFQVNEGIINQITFDGLETVPSFILLRLMKDKPGTPFNSNTILNDRMKLIELGYFSEISAPTLTEDKDKINVNFKVTEKKNNLLNLGVETERSDWYLYGQTNINHLLIPSSLTSLKLQYGRIDNQFQIKGLIFRHYQPWFLNLSPLSMALDAWDEIDMEKYSDLAWHENKREGADLIWGYPLIENRLTVSTKFKGEKVSPVKSFLFTPYEIVSLSLIFDYKNITNTINPKNGNYWTIEAEKSSNFGFIKNMNILAFSRYNFNIAQFIPLGTDDVLGLHFFIGTYIASKPNQQSFEFEGYSIGGSNCLRGYHDMTGAFGAPKEPNKVAFNAEYRHDFTSWLQGVLFCDIGRLSMDWDMSVKYFKLGYGFGFRFFTPVAPIRLDCGWGQEGAIIYLNLGQFF